MLSSAVSVALLVLLSSQESREVQQRHWDWLSQHRFEALDRLMPLEGKSYSPVTFRSYRDLYQDVHEKYFQIIGPVGKPLKATVVTPDGQSIQQQMLEVHMDDSSASFESVIRQVQVSTVTVEERQCPAMREQLEILESLDFTVPDPRRIIIHPVVYSLSLDFSGGELLATLTEEDHPLVRWPIETQRELDACIGGGAP